MPRKALTMVALVMLVATALGRKRGRRASRMVALPVFGELERAQEMQLHYTAHFVVPKIHTAARYDAEEPTEEPMESDEQLYKPIREPNAGLCRACTSAFTNCLENICVPLCLTNERPNCPEYCQVYCNEPFVLCEEDNC